MMIELRSSNLPISGAMREHAERKLELAVGPGVNTLGDEALAMLDDWSAGGSCVPDAGDGAEPRA